MTEETRSIVSPPQAPNENYTRNGVPPFFRKARVARLLRVDPWLARRLGPDIAEKASQALLVRVGILREGGWDPGGEATSSHGGLGVLVLSGLMMRDVGIAGANAAELVGAGDVLHPSDHVGDGAPVPSAVAWQVLEPTRLALLDRSFVLRAAEWPEIISQLFDRAISRTQQLAIALALTRITGIEARVLTLLWTLADRWGRVSPEGVVLPLPLTHKIVARLVGAARPSVSTALRRLEVQGKIVKRRGGGWTLQGEPPADRPLIDQGN